MLDGVRFALTLAATLGSGLVAGVLFAFSSFVLRAFRLLPAAQGIAAMQSVNRTVRTPSFLLVFTGTAVLGAALAGWAAVTGAGHGGGWLLAGGVLYVAGTFVLTGAVHIPRNNALDTVDPHTPEGAAAWARFVPAWTAWNHVRTLAALGACAAFALALAA
ncbi:putative membrane protein [Prauserella shujinwangii]|uniref:Putative membrane protein n=1 Tax=Prauserella shujinwangii TaxID=1453103 RepID=A0A2T0LSD6_9PSEU|nr:anthrone oxygenase family protein [Prauserella shujinwangii]PRX46564.1 putative membrane protein [Prauserella shujinwangii]